MPELPLNSIVPMPLVPASAAHGNLHKNGTPLILSSNINYELMGHWGHPGHWTECIGWFNLLNTHRRIHTSLVSLTNNMDVRITPNADCGFCDHGSTRAGNILMVPLTSEPKVAGFNHFLCQNPNPKLNQLKFSEPNRTLTICLRSVQKQIVHK